jgi:hypothetical protein
MHLIRVVPRLIVEHHREAVGIGAIDDRAIGGRGLSDPAVLHRGKRGEGARALDEQLFIGGFDARLEPEVNAVDEHGDSGGNG